jgi:hypothetical protein
MCLCVLLFLGIPYVMFGARAVIFSSYFDSFINNIIKMNLGKIISLNLAFFNHVSAYDTILN